MASSFLNADGPGTPGWEGTEADPVGLGPEVNSVFNRMTATDFADVPIYWGTQPISVDYQANRVQTPGPASRRTGAG